MKDPLTKFEIRDPLLEPYYILVDSYGYVLLEVTTPNYKRGRKPNDKDKEFKTYEKQIGYYSNFNRCLEKISKLKLNSKNYSSIKEYISEFNSIKDELKYLTKI